MMLQALGYSVNAAANGKEALDLLNSLPSQPDLVITDVAMPDMTRPGSRAPDRGARAGAQDALHVRIRE